MVKVPEVKKAPKGKELSKVEKKRRWRENTYGNKNKVEEWKKQNKKRLERRYFKVLRKEGVDRKSANLTPLGGSEKTNYKQIREDFNKRRLKAEKRQKADEKKRRFEEAKEAREAYKKKKAEKYKILSQKTKRGQPLMRGRLELLYDKIKNKYG